jgi:hypothetical protein
MLLTSRKVCASIMLGLVLGGCAATDIKKATNDELEVLKLGPQAPPFRSITGFSEALRCMDSQMISYGVRDLPVLIEDMNDKTTKINAGTRDMVISAISDITKRSRAVRLITFGSDVSNLANFLANAEFKRAYENIPLFDVRGSVSQLDESLFKKQFEGGLTLGPFGGGAAKSGESTVLAIDLSVITTRDYALVNGVTSRNSVAIYKEGHGVDAEVQYQKLGINYGMTLTRSEGRAQALRTLVELSTIELLGKLTHTPYWMCLGIDPRNSAVSNEIADWFYAMLNNGELVLWIQEQLTLRGLYHGKKDGKRNPEFDAALITYRDLLALPPQPIVDEAFFSRYLGANHAEIASAMARAKQATTSKTAVSPLTFTPPVQKTANNSINLEKTAGVSELVRPVTPAPNTKIICYLLNTC